MERNATGYLEIWLDSKDRKPLVMRGARQVGKTWLIRHFAKIVGRELIELNFEKHPSYVSFFNSNDPEEVLLNLRAAFNQPIKPEHSLLFLDEIQVAPDLLAKLRWFAEDLPALPVIAAGSLLDFVLEEHSFSMPVGRINYMHLEPLTFEEFLLAQNKKFLCAYLSSYKFNTEIPLAIHEQLSLLFREYVLVGGMPAAAQSWVNEHSFVELSRIQHDLLTTYRDDFSKYKGRITLQKLDELMMAVPKQLGQKFKFSKVNSEVSATTIKKVLDLLDKARLSSRVWSCSANGVPLAAEVKPKVFKEIFLDVGLCCASLGVNLTQLTNVEDLLLVNQGGLAEQVVGQLLRTINPPYVEPALYYWQREEKGANAEVDYIIQHANRVVPVEVKAGSTGALKSLHILMGLKKLETALRFNADLPSRTIVKVKTHLEVELSYTLLSLPFYLIGQAHRLLL